MFFHNSLNKLSTIIQILSSNLHNYRKISTKQCKIMVHSKNYLNFLDIFIIHTFF
jgi:hypothetical protein